MHLITVEGLIGIGKTTLANNIAKELGIKVVEEPVQANPYLDAFYKDPKRWALEMQFWLLSTRFRMHRDVIQHIWDSQEACVMDRSIYGDQMFAKQHWLDGNIDNIGYNSYMDHREVVNNQLLVPHVTIFLEADPEICLKRIVSRGRSFEQAIPLSYLKGLQERHFELAYEMKQRGTRVVHIKWDEFKTTNEVLEEAGLSFLKERVLKRKEVLSTP